MPEASARLARQITTFVQELRRTELYKVPGVSETLDWAAALTALGRDALDPDAVHDTIGVLLKTREDIEQVRNGQIGSLLQKALVS